jgi:hypothetical protein
MRNQPELPAEQPFSDLEKVFISESPPGLWPENQDSNFGALRRVLLDPLSNAIDVSNDLFAEAFVPSSVGYLGRWESQYGLPQNPDAPVWFRRVLILNRMFKGPFTKTRRKLLVEAFIRQTFGDPIQLLPAGVPLVSEGVPLFGEMVDIGASYTIVEYVEYFYYSVSVDPAIDLDQIGLERELRWITPAGISFDIIRGVYAAAKVTWAEMQVPES